MNASKHLARLAAAALFGISATCAVVVADAMHAGESSQGRLASAPQPALAGVAIAVGVGGPNRYCRYAYRGGRWQRFGFGYAAAPGYFGGYYLGYAPPPPAYCPPYYQRSYYAAYFGHPYWYPHRRHAYYRHGYYGHPRHGWRR
jgi:hypothetical protein